MSERKRDLRIEPSAGETYRHEGEFSVYSYGVYPRGSVLEGQEKRTCVQPGFTSEAEAKLAYPEATIEGGSGYRTIVIPHTPPSWFDPAAAGEAWDDEDY
jgi:hypothetical protein